MIATWFEIYTDYKEATAVLKRKFCQAYKDTTGKTYRTSTVPDLTPQFELSKTQKEALKNSAEVHTHGYATILSTLLIDQNRHRCLVLESYRNYPLQLSDYYR
ncbi:unnamed protein product [Mucor circinelloides]